MINIKINYQYVKLLKIFISIRKLTTKHIDVKFTITIKKVLKKINPNSGIIFSERQVLDK